MLTNNRWPCNSPPIPVNGLKEKTWRMRNKHESSNRRSRTHQAHSPFVFHAWRPRVLSLLQSPDHEGMVLDMHPVRYVDRICGSDSTADKFINSWAVVVARQEPTHRGATLRKPSTVSPLYPLILWVMSWVTDNHAHYNRSLYCPWQIWWPTLSEG